LQTDRVLAFVVDHVKIPPYLVWSLCKIWLFLILCACM